MNSYTGSQPAMLSRKGIRVNGIAPGSIEFIASFNAAIASRRAVPKDKFHSIVVAYKTSLPTYLIGRMLVTVKMIGLVNIVAGRRIVPEILQWHATPQRLAREAAELLADPEKRRRMSEELAVVRERLGASGASERVAGVVLRSHA